jgi:putative aldouronate transport system substrate-binding protein
MKDYKKSAKFIAILMASMMALMPLTACKSSKTNNSSKTAAVTTITILTKSEGQDENKYTDSRVQKAMTAKIGVKIKVEQVDDDKYNVLLASGDLPDIVRATSDIFNQLIQGNNVIPLDTLLASNGKDVTANVPKAVEFSKKFWSNGSNKVYFLPAQVGASTDGSDKSLGIVIRWDYYKELGFPEINSESDLLNVLSQITKKHPTASNGKKVYGVSMWSDWDNWCLTLPMDSLYGFSSIGKVNEIKVDTNEISCTLTDPNSAYWKCIDFYHNANKMGILDPDSFTQKFDDYKAKATAGQLVYGPVTWAMGDFNANNQDSTNGFVVLPVKFGYQWGGNSNAAAGWPTVDTYAITKSSKNPQKAMDLLNYWYSYDGCRTLYSGVEGTDWTTVNGKPASTAAALKLYQAGGDAYNKTGIGFDDNFIGLSHDTINPKDGKPLDLFHDPITYPSTLTALQKDFSQHFGVSYPEEIFQKYVSQGINKDQSKSNPWAQNLLPTPPDDIQRMEAKLDTILINDAANIILSKTDTAYSANKAAALKDFQAAGVDKVAAWYKTAWDKAMAQANTMN